MYLLLSLGQQLPASIRYLVCEQRKYLLLRKNIFELCDKSCENVVSELLFGRCPAELRRVRAAVPADDAARVAAAAAQRVLPLHRRRRGPRHRALHHGLRAAGL